MFDGCKNCKNITPSLRYIKMEFNKCKRYEFYF